MSNPPMKMFTTVLLDTPRKIRWSNRAKFRLGSLDKPLDLPGTGNARKGIKAITALSQWLWACLFEEHPFTTPEELSEYVSEDNFADLQATLIQCVNLGLQPPKDSKNADSSTPSPSPASS
jgi:hypothetical protein